MKQNRIDAYIVKQIHDVTDKYDTFLESILDQGQHIKSNPHNEIRNSRDLCGALKDLSQEILLDLWKDPARRNEKFNGYAWNGPRLFKILSQPFTRSRTLMGLADIDRYIEGISQNYVVLKEAIEAAAIEAPVNEAPASIADS